MKTQILALCLLALTITACSTTIEKPFLYEAEKDGKKLHLLGTMHRGIPIWDLPESVTGRLKAANMAFFEVDMSDIKLSDEEKQARARERRNEYLYIAHGEPQLDALLTKQELEVLARGVPTIPIEELKKMRPEAILDYADKDADGEEITYYEARLLDSRNSLDYALSRLAREAKVPTIALESKLSERCRKELDAESLADLKHRLAGKPIKHHYGLFKEMEAAYREGDEQRLRELAAEDTSENSCILKDRNENWVGVLDRYLIPNETAFVAVGAAHLVGVKEQSVLEMLASRGYKVRRIAK